MTTKQTNLMARFGPDSFEAQHMGENNAVKYRLIARGSNLDSLVPAASCTVNGIEASTGAYQRGMNIIVLDSVGGFVEHRVFDIYANDEHRTTLQTYINGLPNDRIVCFMSWDAIKSNASLDGFMTKIGSVAWPGEAYFNRTIAGLNVFRASYSAVYNSTMKKICLEDFVPNDASKQVDTRSITEVVFDTVLDVGATGTPERLIDDQTEYTGDGSAYAFRQWNFPSKVPADIRVGDTFYFECELYANKTLIDAGGYTQLYVWSQDSAGLWLTSVSVAVKTADTWQKLSGYFTVRGETSTSVGCSVYHTPSSVKTGIAKCRNVILTKVSRTDVKKTVSIGVNGANSSKMTEEVNPVMKLLGMSFNNNSTTSNKFKEVDA